MQAQLKEGPAVSDDADKASLPSILAALSTELQRTQEHLDGMMETVFEQISPHGGPSDSLVRSLQDHDRITQRLACLSRAAQALATQHEAGTQRLREALGEAVHMADLRRALMGEPTPIQEQEDDSDEIDLF